MPFSSSGPSGKNLMRPLRPERALAVAALAAVLFLEPFLGIFDRGGSTTVWGVPMLFAYLFGAWSLVVVLTAVVMENRNGRAESGEETPPTAGAAGAEDLPDQSGPA